MTRGHVGMSEAMWPTYDVWMDEADSEEEKVEEESYITGMDALFLSESYFYLLHLGVHLLAAVQRRIRILTFVYMCTSRIWDACGAAARGSNCADVDLRV
jgi:hypothetical protein